MVNELGDRLQYAPQDGREQEVQTESGGGEKPKEEEEEGGERAWRIRESEGG